MSLSSRSIFVPSAVSSFFEVCDEDQEGNKIEDPLKVGARGGGFRISKGVTTQATIGQTTQDEVYINSRLTPEAKTSLEAIRLARQTYGFQGYVCIRHKVDVPIGCGFGTSAAGALGTIIAIQDMLGVRDRAYAADLAHIAEVKSLTGLGTVIAAASEGGSVGLVTEPGAPSLGAVRLFDFDSHEYVFVSVVFGAVDKASILSSKMRKKIVNKWGRRVLEAILDEPTPVNLLKQSLLFAEKTGIATRDLLDLAHYIQRRGAEGAAQNMIGRAVHSVVAVNRVEQILKDLRHLLPFAKIVTSPFYAGSVQILEESLLVDRVRRFTDRA
ncbi:MAG: hypothetical protein QXN08_05705 [Nitrososphaerales archaeon]